MYTGLKFKGVVREKFRQDFDKVIIMGRWDKLNDSLLAEFGEYERSDFIPHGSAGVTYEWEKQEIPHIWNEKTGEWQFTCGLKNYEDVIQEFIDLLPYLCEKVELCEVFYEEWDFSERWDVKENYSYLAEKPYKQYRS